VIDVLRADWRHQQLRFVSGTVLSNKPGAACEICAARRLSDVEIEIARGSTLANAGSSSLRQLASPFAGSLRPKGLS
jgi:hypothetical protein